MNSKHVFLGIELIFAILIPVVLVKNSQYVSILIPILLVGLTTSLGISIILDKLEKIEKKLNEK